MAKNLVIVESPSKATTIKKFLGSNYEVVASNGHVRDLPKSQLGIDIDNDFEPKYITIRGKGELLAKLRREVKKADKIFLATDPDREGEAISWHLLHALNLDTKNTSRITFNEITKNAVKQAIKQAREIDMDLVDAQQARRVLDRLVGYQISPVLWAKVKRGLSAGRVQSVALRIIADREEEINSFIAKEYWTLTGDFLVEGSKKPFTADFYGLKNKKLTIESEKEMDKIIKELEKSHFSISDIKESAKSKKSPLPFTTSTLQQEASKSLNFSTQKTMSVAQSLYEGVKVKGRGMIGLITYLRTDSTRVSEEAKQMAAKYIADTYGEDYLATEEKKTTARQKIQDAHECIRPTYAELTPTILEEALTKDQLKLYRLIWKRFMASRMAPAKLSTTTVKIDSDKYRFTSAATKVVFAGYLTVYQTEEDKIDKKTLSKKLVAGAAMEAEGFQKKQHFTQPPAHFTEASLVKTLEELGIGRPSTYAPTISTIINRRYVAKEKKNLYITELGEVVNSIMKKSFATIVDVDFTANMEGLLDRVEEGVVKWRTVVENFYPDLHDAVEKAQEELEQIEIEDEVTEVICEECGRNMVVKYGPHGKFLACPGFPECRNTKPYLEKVGVACPKCGEDIVFRKTKKGRRYYGCITYPECDFMSWQRPSVEKCPKCQGPMVEKGNKLVCMDEKCGFFKSKQNEEK